VIWPANPQIPYYLALYRKCLIILNIGGKYIFQVFLLLNKEAFPRHTKYTHSIGKFHEKTSLWDKFVEVCKLQILPTFRLFLSLLFFFILFSSLPPHIPPFYPPSLSVLDTGSYYVGSAVLELTM
jgi:hypothetical protein